MTRLRALILCAALAGCAQAPQELVVGSKPFTESELAGELIAQLAEASGAKVRRRFYLAGMLCFQALRAGEMDLYVEYTGTGLVDILQEPAQSDPKAVYLRVREEFQRRWGLRWLAPLGFNNTYTLVMRRADAERLGVRAISELASWREKPRCGFDLVFRDRRDGYAGLKERYGELCRSVHQMSPGLMYQALAGGEVDMISGYATDGRIASLGLARLADDKRFFPPYDAAPLAAPGALEKAPGLQAKLEALAGRLSDEKMTRLNAEVDMDKRPVAEVARAFLRREGLLD